MRKLQFWYYAEYRVAMLGKVCICCIYLGVA